MYGRRAPVAAFLLVAGLLVPARSFAQAPPSETIHDVGTPVLGPKGGDVLVAEVGAPDDSPSAPTDEHRYVEAVARTAHASEVLDGDYGIDKLVSEIADPARKSGARPKISTLFFVGHMTYPADPSDMSAHPKPLSDRHGYILAGKVAASESINDIFVSKLAAALQAKGLTPDDVFAPGALVELKVCNAARDTRPFLDDLAKLLPRGSRIKAYDAPYAYESGAGMIGLDGKPYLAGPLGPLLGEKPSYDFNLGDQRDGLVEIPGTFEESGLPLSSLPVRSTPNPDAATDLAHTTTVVPTGPATAPAATAAAPSSPGTEGPSKGFVAALSKAP
jgi:hypothetical protein